MRPSRSILDRDFRYVPSIATSVAETWKRFGWRPMKKPKRMQPLDTGQPTHPRNAISCLQTYRMRMR